MHLHKQSKLTGIRMTSSFLSDLAYLIAKTISALPKTMIPETTLLQDVLLWKQ